MPANGWSSFWINQKKSFHEVMRVATAGFASRLKARFSLQPNDHLFDYGCGPGFLEDELASSGVKITGADINPAFLHESREKHPRAKFVSITTSLKENQTTLAAELKDSKFSYIVVLSIFQYFKDTDEVEQTIAMLREYLSANGRIIIADVIDERTSSATDAIALLRHCLAAGKVTSFVRFIFYVLSSDYREAAKSERLLHIPEKTMREIARRQGLGLEVVPNLTIHPSRSNYLLTRPV